MVLKSNFGGILDLVDGVSEGLTCSSGSHGTGNSYFCLTATLRTGDGGIALCKFSEQAGNSEASDNLVIGKFSLVLQIIEYGGKYSAGATGRSGYYYSVIGILFTTSICIRANKLAFHQFCVLVLGNLLMKELCLSVYMKRSRKHAFP